MNKGKPRQPDYTTTPYGTRVLTKTLVETLRQFRGRLPRSGLCQAMGWQRTPENMRIIHNLCVRWEIVTADFVPMPKVQTPGSASSAQELLRRERAMQIAAETRMKEIALARAEMNSAPPYKVGDLSWGAKP